MNLVSLSGYKAHLMQQIMFKQLILAAACALCFIQLSAQQPEHIYSFATVLKPVSWYKQQAELWKKETEKNPQNGEAWYNYYRATRNTNRLDTTLTLDSKQRQEQEQKIVEEMGKAIPDSYEYNLCRWLIAGNNYADIQYLKRAEELAGNKITHFADVIVWGEIERDANRKFKYAAKWYDSRTASPGLLYYNYNVLIGLKPNAVIFTAGDNDTYPLWLLQSQGIRKDVTVLNLSLLYIDEYRNKIFNELGAAPWNMEPASYSVHDKKQAADVKKGQKKESRYNTEIVKHVAANTRKCPVYIGLTVSDEYTKPIGEDLFLTGLAYEYSTKTIDNIAYLRHNFEQLYALDYLDKHFFADISEHWVKMTNANYVVPMVKLYEHYKEAGEQGKAEAIKTKALNMFKNQTDKTSSFITEEEIKAYFN